MKYIIFLTVFLFGSFFITQKILANNADVIINEIGAYPTSTHEWIEIWNKGSEPVDIKDWKFWENNTNHSLKPTTSSDSTMSPGEYGIIAQSSDIFLKDYPQFVGSVFDSSWAILSENGEEIGLKDEQGNFVEKFIYLPTTKFSLERKDPFLNDYTNLNWQENIDGNTVGFKNNNLITNFVTGTLNLSTTTLSVSTTVLSVDIFSDHHITSSIFNWPFIKLNEIVSDPENGNEQVELFNNNSSTLNVSGGSICDSTQNNCKILNGEITGYSWLVADLLTDRYLNNASDTVFLKDQNNNIIDTIVYGENLGVPKKGQSLIRKIDGEDSDDDLDWAITDKITLGANNELAINAPVSAGGESGRSFLGNSSNSNMIAKIITSTEKNSKISPKITKTEERDQVKMVWELHWPYGLDIAEQGIFNARGTADPRGGEISFLWNFGDNTTGTGHLLGHQYATSGVYLVSVLASSTSGTFGKKEFKVYVGPTFSVALSDIRITSWQINSPGDLPEYIELKNNLGKKQNISGWKIKNKSWKEYEFPEDTFMSPSSTLKFFRAVTHLNFNKDEDSIRLTSPNDQVVDVVSWRIDKEKINIKKPLSTGGKKIRQSLKGMVTVEPGVFGSQFFYITDGQSGTQVYQYQKDFPDIKIGDYVQVRGEFSQSDNVKRIKIQNKNDVDILSAGNIVSALPVLPKDFTEEISGALVKLSGDITEIKTNYLYLDDGESETMIYLYKGANINGLNFKEGDKIEVTGLLDKNKNGWRVLPRSNADIKVAAHSQSEALNNDQADLGVKNEMAQSYFTATAGGLTALLFGLLAKTRGVIIMSAAKKAVSLAVKAIRRG